MNTKKLNEFLESNNHPNFRFKQIINAIFKNDCDSFDKINNLPKDLRDQLSKSLTIIPFQTKEVLISKDKKSIKAILETTDNSLIETVLIKNSTNNWTACLSSQIGCTLGCKFCATGASGFTRDLTSEEITGQILFLKHFLNQQQTSNTTKTPNPENNPDQKDPTPTISNIVFMGMGEPFLNWRNVKKAIQDLTDQNLFNFAARSISISTSGIIPGIEELAKSFPQINLAISLHSANPETRSSLMPINNEYPLDRLKKSIERYINTTNRKVLLEYILIKNITDTQEQAKRLIDFINQFNKKHLLHVNLIKFNQTTQKFQPSSKTNIQFFQKTLKNNRINVTLRQSLGSEIEGACGQLKNQKAINS